jgi:hypothetical protein
MCRSTCTRTLWSVVEHTSSSAKNVPSSGMISMRSPGLTLRAINDQWRGLSVWKNGAPLGSKCVPMVVPNPCRTNSAARSGRDRTSTADTVGSRVFAIIAFSSGFGGAPGAVPAQRSEMHRGQVFRADDVEQGNAQTDPETASAPSVANKGVDNIPHDGFAARQPNGSAKALAAGLRSLFHLRAQAARPLAETQTARGRSGPIPVQSPR